MLKPYHAYDMQKPYLRLILGFIGTLILKSSTAIILGGGDDARTQAIANAQSALKDAIAHS